MYTPINLNKINIANKTDNTGVRKKCSFYQEPNSKNNSNDMSTFSNSATLLINANSKLIENPLANSMIYTQVYPSSQTIGPSGRNLHKTNTISSMTKEVNLCNNDKTILIDTNVHHNHNNINKSNMVKSGSNSKTNTLPSNETFTSKLPPVPRRNSKNTLMQNSNTNLNVLSSTHNINKTFNETTPQHPQQDSAHHLNSLMSLNKSKLYQKI